MPTARPRCCGASGCWRNCPRDVAAAAAPEDVPDLKEDNAEGEVLSMRDRMVQHRANPVCASCHAMMDPLGLALEHFDAVGRWRTRSEAFTPIDASGTMLDGTTFDGVDGLREVLLSRSELFVTTLTEKLLTYGLGRGVESWRCAGGPEHRAHGGR